MDLEQKPNGRENSFKCFKDNIIQALEELRVKRQLEVTNTERINQLLKEKFDLSRQKDELACELQKETDSMAQRLAETERELQETKEKLLGFERKQKSVENYETEGIRVLKEEIIALQTCAQSEKKRRLRKLTELAKHNLAKKMKEQDYQYNMQTTAKENLIKQLKNIQDRVKLVEQQREKTQHELMNIEASVQKATLFQNRVLRVNNHQQCTLDRLKSDLATVNDELLKARMTINKFNYSVNRYEEKPGFDIAKKITEPKHDLIKEKLEEQMEQLKKENDRLLEELNKQTDITNQLNTRLTTISTSEMGLHFVIDDLKAENTKLRGGVHRYDLVDKEVQVAEEVIDEKDVDGDVLLQDEIARVPLFCQDTVNSEIEDTMEHSTGLQEVQQTVQAEMDMDGNAKTLKEEPLS